MVVWGGYRRQHGLPQHRRAVRPGHGHLDGDLDRGGAVRRVIDHTAVWTGSVMVVWGGYDAQLRYLNTGGRYDPATDTWTATSTVGAPSARYDHTAVWTGNLMVVWGGYDGSSYLNTGGRYDPATDTWTADLDRGGAVRASRPHRGLDGKRDGGLGRH